MREAPRASAQVVSISMRASLVHILRLAACGLGLSRATTTVTNYIGLKSACDVATGATIAVAQTIFWNGGDIEISSGVTVTMASSNSASPKTLDGESSDRHFTVYGALTVSYLVLANGLSSGNGGSIIVQDYGTLTVFDSTFTGCSSPYVGGALYITDNAVVSISNSYFVSNTASVSVAMRSIDTPRPQVVTSRLLPRLPNSTVVQLKSMVIRRCPSRGLPFLVTPGSARPRRMISITRYQMLPR